MIIDKEEAILATDVDRSKWTSEDNTEAWWACGEVIKAIRVNIMNLPEGAMKHGHWETVYLDHMSAGRRPTLFSCSQCCECAIFKTDYCPHCGAKMDGPNWEDLMEK